MKLYSRRSSGLHEIVDGQHLSKDIDPQFTTPMCVLTNGHHAYTQEPNRLASGELVWPERWFTEGDSLRGEGYLLEEQGTSVRLAHHHKRIFDVSEIVLTYPQIKAIQGKLQVTSEIFYSAALWRVTVR